MANGQHDQSDLVSLTADVVAAYVGNNTVSAADLPILIQSVQEALQNAISVGIEEPEEERKPAVPIRSSVKSDHIVCLEDGKKFKSLRRHLRTEHDLTPQEYRQKWGLKPDYPMVAPEYAEARSKLAKSIGLGQKTAAASNRP